MCALFGVHVPTFPSCHHPPFVATLLTNRSPPLALRYGYVTSCPSNLGTGMRASVHLKLPHLTGHGETTVGASAVAKEFGLQVSKAFAIAVALVQACLAPRGALTEAGRQATSAGVLYCAASYKVFVFVLHPAGVLYLVPGLMLVVWCVLSPLMCSVIVCDSRLSINV